MNDTTDTEERKAQEWSAQAPNWQPMSLLHARDLLLERRDGTRYLLKLYPDGWAVGEIAYGLSAVDACRILNDMQARPIALEPGHADDCPMNNRLFVSRGYDLYGHPTRCQCSKAAQGPQASPVPAEPEKETADRYFDPTSRFTWLDFGHRVDDALYKELVAAGWRYSGYRKMFRTNRRFPTIPQRVDARDQGEVNYAEERADRLNARAQRVQSEAQTRYDKAGKLADMIPLGQPILVGHHSEGRHRRDLARIETNTRKALDGFDTANELQRRAEASTAHQARKHTPGALARRIDRLEAEERKLLRDKWQHCRTDAGKAHWQEVYNKIHGELEAARKELADAGGIPADALNLHVGALVRCDGFIIQITRVNPKTISGVVTEGGAKGWSMKWDKSKITALVRNADGTLPVDQAGAEEVTHA